MEEEGRLEEYSRSSHSPTVSQEQGQEGAVCSRRGRSRGRSRGRCRSMCSRRGRSSKRRRSRDRSRDKSRGMRRGSKRGQILMTFHPLTFWTYILDFSILDFIQISFVCL